MEIICPTCNRRYNIPENKIPIGKRASTICKNCGGKIAIDLGQGDNPDNGFEFISEPSETNNPENILEITEKDFIDFIGPNAEKYINNFRKFNIEGVDQYSFTWHWPAFFVSFFWMLYRKLYLWALLAFFLSYIPIAGFVLMIVYGLTGNYLYYKHTKKKIMELKSQQSSADLSLTLRQIGGINQWVKTLAIVLTILVILGILAAIIIPLLAFRSHHPLNL
jgi:hypothetical protein